MQTLLTISGVLILAVLTRSAPAQESSDAPDRITKRQQREEEKARAAAMRTAVLQELESTLTTLQDDGDFDAAQVRIDATFDRVIIYVPASEQDIFRAVAFARRLVRQLVRAETEAPMRRELLKYLLNNQLFARTLVFTMHPQHDDPSKVFAIVERLCRARGQHLDRYASLAAAICLVHDEPKPMRVNENWATSPDPIAVFDFYVANEDRMLFGIRDVPAELLMYVVDVAASIDEMNWALNRYAGDTNVGRRFFEIEYDREHVREGAEKTVTRLGWTLPNILTYGGVCADQAYFAVTVGKSIGVPATYTTGRSASSSHAWVGFLQANRQEAWWNFSAGRYADYQNTRGTVIDPQTRRRTPDSTVSLRAAHLRSSIAAREFAAAMTDASQRLASAGRKNPFAGEPFTDDTDEVLRTPTIDHVLDLLKEGLRASPGTTAGWFSLRGLALRDDFTLDHCREWGTFLNTMCGQQYQDFYLLIVTSLIKSIDDAQVQNSFWNTAFNTFRNRPDLAASVRLSQGRMWAKKGEAEQAGRCFEDVIMRYANDGPFVVDALDAASTILRKQRDGRRLLALYESTWNRTRRPDDVKSAQFAIHSNWYRVGSEYAEILDEAGLTAEANHVRADLRSMTR